MNKFNFQQTGGFPIDTNIFNDIEEAYSLFNVFGALAGDKTIISGCVEIGNNVSDGYVYVNGELFKFLGGQKGSTIVLIEESTAAIFEDGQTKTILKKRYYQFGSGVGALTWESFKRFDALTSLTNRVLKLETPIHGQIEIVQSDLKQYGSNPGGLVQHQFRKKYQEITPRAQDCFIR
ncbi:hypothetical protein QNH98_04710 [Myroides sp. mNGS23_01]|nr:hypothetical protein [Myroides sp. mNGS23_01]WHT39962.1 hypothetical protein QNH98_04710 [Myroides sp. mNGS23_01]